MTETTGKLLKDALAEYLQSLEVAGKHPRTLYTYGQDCKQILSFFGSEKQLTKLLPAHVARFYRSNELLRIPKNGKDRAPATVKKTVRVLHRFLRWAKEQGYIETLPRPKQVK